MTNKQIDASREARLWLGQIVLPIVGVVMMVPEAREAAMTKVKQAKRNIENKFGKKVKEKRLCHYDRVSSFYIREIYTLYYEKNDRLN